MYNELLALKATRKVLFNTMCLVTASNAHMSNLTTFLTTEPYASISKDAFKSVKYSNKIGFGP